MKKIFNLILIVFCFTPILSQIKTASGDISVLAGEKELSVTFSYDDMNVHGYPSEKEFIKDKVRIREEKKPGSGKVFKDSWFADRDTVYEPIFIKNINYALSKKRKIVVSKNNSNAKYNLHIKTLWVYPGYSVGWSQPSKIDVAFQLYEKSNPEKILWESKSPIRIKAKIAPYARELRIGASYMALGKSMSWFLNKKAK